MTLQQQVDDLAYSYSIEEVDAMEEAVQTKPSKAQRDYRGLLGVQASRRLVRENPQPGIRRVIPAGPVGSVRKGQRTYRHAVVPLVIDNTPENIQRLCDEIHATLILWGIREQGEQENHALVLTLINLLTPPPEPEPVTPNGYKVMRRRPR
jgi:hypothetical protein